MISKDENHARPRSPDNGDRPDRPGVLTLIGNTPLVPIRKVNPNPKVEIFAKLEGANPGGSVKDRIALTMIEEAESNVLRQSPGVVGGLLTCAPEQPAPPLSCWRTSAKSTDSPSRSR